MLRLGLLSTARINRSILAAATVTDSVEVVAVASRDAVRAVAYARDNGISRAHGSYDALLADPEVDAVYVSLPNALHHEWTMRALAAGKHVLCEKPYSRLPGEVGEAFDRSEGADLVLTEAFMYRHHPQTRIVADLVSSGAIGAPRLVKAEFSFRLEDPADIRLNPELAGGSLMDVGCYCVSGLRLIAGEPDSATGEQRVGAAGTDMSFRGALRFPSGVAGLLHCSFELPRRQELEVVGEEGWIRVDAPWRVDWGGGVLLERDGTVTRVDVPVADSYALELDNFAQAVAGIQPPLLGREDASGQASAIDALYRAAESGRTVSL